MVRNNVDASAIAPKEEIKDNKTLNLWFLCSVFEYVNFMNSPIDKMKIIDKITNTIYLCITNKSLFVNTVNQTPSLGDLYFEQSFSALNAQLTPATITNFAFSNTRVRYFRADVSVYINTTSGNIASGYELKGIQQNSTNGNWLLNTTFIGSSPPNVNFTISTSGQLQYTSSSVGAFVSSTLHFRALTLSV